MYGIQLVQTRLSLRVGASSADGVRHSGRFGRLGVRAEFAAEADLARPRRQLDAWRRRPDVPAYLQDLAKLWVDALGRLDKPRQEGQEKPQRRMCLVEYRLRIIQEAATLSSAPGKPGTERVKSS